MSQGTDQPGRDATTTPLRRRVSNATTQAGQATVESVELEIRSIACGDDQTHTVAHVALDRNGDLTISAGNPGYLDFLMHFGCVGPGGRIYEWTDGEPWVRALPGNLRGAYTWTAVPPATLTGPTKNN